MEETVHYLLGPSSSKRWLTCPHSLRYDQTSEPNEAAQAGTIAHKLAQDSLEAGHNPAFDTVILEASVYNSVQPIFGGRRKADPRRIARAAGVYADVVCSLPGERLLEQTIAHNSIENFGGTVDCMAFGDSLTIADLKTGKWAVETEGNTQLLCYAVLARQKLNYKGDVRALIVQPHVFPEPQGTVFSSGQLDEFEAAVNEAAHSNEAVYGEHCRFCKAWKIGACEPGMHYARCHGWS